MVVLGHQHDYTKEYWNLIKEQLKNIGGNCCNCCSLALDCGRDTNNSCGCQQVIPQDDVKGSVYQQERSMQTTRPPRQTRTTRTTSRPYNPPMSGGGSSSGY